MEPVGTPRQNIQNFEIWLYIDHLSSASDPNNKEIKFNYIYHMDRQLDLDRYCPHFGPYWDLFENLGAKITWDKKYYF